MLGIDSIVGQLSELTQNGIAGMSDQEIKDYRKQIVALNNQCRKALAETSQKELNIEDTEVFNYIQAVLEDGYNCVNTKLSTNKALIDAQQLSWFKSMIKACVQNSAFSSNKFKIKGLEYQRSAIENSNTLHELRQNIKAMIGPLRMYRKNNNQETVEYDLTTMDQLIVENEKLKFELKDRQRVIEEITNLYNIAIAERDSKAAVVKSVDDLKVSLGINDEEACKIVGISRSTVKRLRKELEIITDSQNPLEDSIILPVFEPVLNHENEPCKDIKVVRADPVVTVFDELDVRIQQNK